MTKEALKELTAMLEEYLEELADILDGLVARVLFWIYDLLEGTVKPNEKGAFWT